MRDDLPTGTVTFLFTDVEGSTNLLHSLGAEAYADALAQHRRVVREACVSLGGVEVDTQGDAFFFAFSEAAGALQAAEAVRSGLSTGRLRVRIGIHSGRPYLNSEGYVGEDVHRAARIAAAGHGGQVLVSVATRALLDVEKGLLSLGAHRLKDFEAPVTLYQLGEGAFPPLKTIANSNLPTPASSFLGRELELVEADLLLRETRLLTVTGPGGAGKTRFALELARRAREERFSEYEDGVFSCFLSSLRDPGLVLPTIAQTLSLREEPGRSALETLAAQLQGKRMLLFLDNLEHLLAAAPELSQLLTRCPALTLLVTSRERLRLQGEVAYELPPLSEEEGVLLFCERARASPAQPIRALCQHLEGLPLAIELAAARMRILSPEQLAARLAKRLDLLKGERDADPRQQTLRATIEWSYELLTLAEQELFASLSVFAGGCTLEAAEEVCAADLDTLQSLVDKSLLRYSDGRFWMLETIREYADERLEDDGGAAKTQLAHAEYYLALAEAAEPDLRAGGEQPAWMERLETEYGNIRAALQYWSLDPAADGLERFLAAIFRFWEIRPRFTEAEVWFGRVLARSSPASPPLQAQVLFAAGRSARWSNDARLAVERLNRALVLFRRLRDDRAASACAGFLSNVLLLVGDDEGAKTLSRESVERAHASGDALTLATALHNRGVLLREKGDAEAATECLRGGLATFRKLRMNSGMANALVNLGLAELGRGDYRRAHEYLSESLEVSASLGDSGWRTMTLRALSHHALLTGQPADALAFATDALELARRQGDEELILAALKDVASACVASDDRIRAARLAGAADQRDERFSSFWSADDQRIWARFMPTRESLVDAAEARAWDSGAALSLDEAVADGLSRAA